MNRSIPKSLMLPLIFGVFTSGLVGQDLPPWVANADFVAKFEWLDGRWKGRTLKCKEGTSRKEEESRLLTFAKHGEHKQRAHMKPTPYYLIYTLSPGRTAAKFALITPRKGTISLENGIQRQDLPVEIFEKLVAPQQAQKNLNVEEFVPRGHQTQNKPAARRHPYERNPHTRLNRHCRILLQSHQK